jgi:hypothetical protein
MLAVTTVCHASALQGTAFSVDLTVDSGLVGLLGCVARSLSLLVGVVTSLVYSLCFGDWMSFSCTVTLGAAGKGGRPCIWHIATQVQGTPGVLGHTIDLGSVVAWYSWGAESSNTPYQVCRRSWVWCCKPFGYDPYHLQPSGHTMEISAVGLSG